MKTLRIDDKWSIEYDPNDNDRPKRVTRYGQDALVDFVRENVFTAMFYALLDAKK